MNLSMPKKALFTVLALSALGGCESLSLGDITDVLAAADIGVPNLGNLDTVAEMSDAEAVLAGVVMAAEMVAQAEQMESNSAVSSYGSTNTPTQLSSSKSASSSIDGTTFRFDCPGGYGDPHEVPMPYKSEVCVAAAKEFSQVFVCNQVSKMQAAQNAFYSKCADEIYE